MYKLNKIFFIFLFMNSLKAGEYYKKLPSHMTFIVNNMVQLKSFDIDKPSRIRIFRVKHPGECLYNDMSESCKLTQLLVTYSNLDYPRIEEAFLFNKMWNVEVKKLSFLETKSCISIEYRETRAIKAKSSINKPLAKSTINQIWQKEDVKKCLKIKSVEELLNLSNIEEENKISGTGTQ